MGARAVSLVLRPAAHGQQPLGRHEAGRRGRQPRHARALTRAQAITSVAAGVEDAGAARTCTPMKWRCSAACGIAATAPGADTRVATKGGARLARSSAGARQRCGCVFTVRINSFARVACVPHEPASFALHAGCVSEPPSQSRSTSLSSVPAGICAATSAPAPSMSRTRKVAGSAQPRSLRRSTSARSACRCVLRATAWRSAARPRCSAR